MESSIPFLERKRKLGFQTEQSEAMYEVRAKRWRPDVSSSASLSFRRIVFGRQRRRYSRLGGSVHRQVDAIEALQATVREKRFVKSERAKCGQAGFSHSQEARVRTVCDFGSAPRSPPVTFSIVNRRGPSLPCKSRKPFTGRREEPVTNCSRRDLVSTGQDLTVCACVKTGR